MLSDQEMQLLTAFVDGELTQRQRKAVMRLLEKSSEARAMLKQLQENVHRVKRLPYHKVEPSLVEEVLQAIGDQQTQRRPMGRRRAWLPYLAASMAACLLIGVLSLLYWKTVIGSPVGPKDIGPDIAKHEHLQKIEPLPTPIAPPKKDHALLAQAAAIVEGTNHYFSNYVPAPPYQVFFGDLAKADTNESVEFTHRLDIERSVYLNVTVNNNDAAMTRLREALKARQISLVTDPAVNKVLKGKNAPKAEFLVYAENLTTDDVTKLMRELGQQYIVGNKMNQKLVDSPYQKLTIAPSDGEKLQSVAKTLGVAVSAVELKDRKDVKAAQKKDRQAIVLPATGAGSTSKEVRQFISQRPAPQAGTLQVIIKIRQE